MKKWIFILFFCSSSNLINAQKIIQIGGNKVTMRLIDSVKFDIRGVWKIVDRKFFYDDGNYSHIKWDSLDKGNAIFINDTMFYACTANISPTNLITSPIFIKNIDTKFSSGGLFFEQFSDTVLHISVWGKDDLARSKEIESPVSTYAISVLNNDNIIIAYSNSFLYLERIKHPTGREGWKQENGYNVAYLGKNGIARIYAEYSKYVVKNNNVYLDYIFSVYNAECKNGNFTLLNPTFKELESSRRFGKTIIEINSFKENLYHGRIEQMSLQGDFIRVGYYVTNIDCNRDRGKFMWKIVENTSHEKK